MKVRELVAELKKLPQDYEVYTSSDTEGNSYCSYQADYMVGGSDEDRVIALMPIDDSLQYEDIMPKDAQKVDEMFDKENK